MTAEGPANWTDGSKGPVSTNSSLMEPKSLQQLLDGAKDTPSRLFLECCHEYMHRRDLAWALQPGLQLLGLGLSYLWHAGHQCSCYLGGKDLVKRGGVHTSPDGNRITGHRPTTVYLSLLEIQLYLPVLSFNIWLAGIHPPCCLFWYLLLLILHSLKHSITSRISERKHYWLLLGDTQRWHQGDEVMAGL